LEAALVRWATETDARIADVVVSRNDTRPTLAELGNLFADS